MANSASTQNSNSGSPIRKKWHEESKESLLNSLEVDLQTGLTHAQAETRKKEFGKNELKTAKSRSVFQMFFSQFKDFMVLVLIAASGISFLVGERADTIAILVIVVLNAVLGFVQEFRAERSMEALRAMTSPQARVRRDGKNSLVSASELVPGDIVHLEAGGLVPADLRLVETFQLNIEEAALTGESVPSEKHSDAEVAADSPVGDRRNMAFKGTLVTNGRGLGLVVGTGMKTELGHIANLLQSKGESSTPLQLKLARFGKRLSFVVIGLCVVIFVTGLMRGEEPLLMFMTALSLAVAAIPEALPAVVTVGLALGAKRMVKRNALVRRLHAVETLGSVTFICSDKTGTLTQNQMTVSRLAFGKDVVDVASKTDAQNEQSHKLFLQAVALNNDATFSADGNHNGDPTETALLEFAYENGFEKPQVENLLPREAEIPFSSERGKMSTLHAGENGKYILFTKGAPERVLKRCHFAKGSQGFSTREEARDVAIAMASQGLRVLAFAYREFSEKPNELNSDIEESLSLLGFVGLIDPPRPEVKDAIQTCQRAKTHVVMITGDHPSTAVAIANQLGILNEDDDNDKKVITGQELAKLNADDFKKKVKELRVYARVSPEQKINIVSALQGCGEFVAMTGDGVNDAPALKSANIGISMGKVGTDVAREASHMVLLDDNFSTIVSAMREGRRIFDNIKKFIKFVLAGNVAEILTLFVAPFLGLPLPLLPIHILWVNVVTDGLPGLALAVEKEEKDVMNRPPRHPSESIFAGGVLFHMLWAGAVMATLTLGVLAWAQKEGMPWQTMAFTVLTFLQMFHIFGIRANSESLLKQGVFSNRPLVGAVLLTFVLQLLILYVPILQSVFQTEPLNFIEMAICLAVSPIILIFVEFEKYLRRKFSSRRQN